MKIRKTVGIDLGTTNSVIALLDATDTTLITGQDEQGRKTFPSVVGYRADDRRSVTGHAAARLRGSEAGAVSSVKRSMGLDRAFAVGPDRLTPPHLSARILTHLRNVLARTLTDPRYLLDSAIITMPAYFNHNQIEATRQAGELAGFEVVELLHEPTAAALYYSWLLGHEAANYLVYDLGGGTFDVSVIRKHHGDYEVVSVSGDPFLGGDDFDRLLAAHLMNAAGLSLEPGTPNFERLVQAAEAIKVDLSVHERTRRFLPDWLRDDHGAPIPLEAEVDRATFHRLIKDKVDRTIECCQEALQRARAKAGLRLADIDHVILVGGSSKIPLVRDTVKAAFCNPGLAEHARSPEPLLHEPDLCVAYGAALRAATYGTRYIVDCRLPIFDCPALEEGDEVKSGREGLELHVTSPGCSSEPTYRLTGVVRPWANTADNRQSKIKNQKSSLDLEAGSVRLQVPATGQVEEAFLDERGTFEQEVELRPEGDTRIDLAVCDSTGRELAEVSVNLRHQPRGRQLGPGVLPTQLITKPLQIEVLNRRSQTRIKQVVAPVGASLPGTFACTCRTVDQTGQIVVPVFEENRLIKRLVIDGIDQDLPAGSPVDVEFRIDVQHNIEVRVQVRPGGGGRDHVTTARIEAPPPTGAPSREEVEEVRREVEELLRDFSGSFRTRLQAQARRLVQDVLEALGFADEPKAIQRMAELRDLLQQLQVSRSQILDPPWPRFAQLVKQCLVQAGAVADRTGRSREELFEQVYAQERYAEQAFAEKNQTLYRECWDNLARLAGYLDRLLSDSLPRFQRPSSLSPEEEADRMSRGVGEYLEAVSRRAREKRRADLQERLERLARQSAALPERTRSDPHGAIREARRLATEVAKIEEELTGTRREAGREGTAGLLEGSL